MSRLRGLFADVAVWGAVLVSALLFAGVASVFLMMALAAKANAHGWYDPECCNGNDCSPVESDAIHEGKDGYSVPTGEVIPYNDGRVRESLDGNYHWCHIGSRTYCIYRPSRGM